MNLYKISQNVSQGYDKYDSAVVAAESEEQARNTHPTGTWDNERRYSEWAEPSQVTVELIGVATTGVEAGVIVASFNAG